MCTIYITLIQISIYFIVVKIITVALSSLLNSHLSIFLEKKKPTKSSVPTVHVWISIIYILGHLCTCKLSISIT